MSGVGGRSGPIDVVVGWFGHHLGRLIASAIGVAFASAVAWKAPDAFIDPTRLEERARPDPYTGTMAKQDFAERDRRIKALELAARDNERHIQASAKGWDLIYKNRSDNDRQDAAIELIWVEVHRLRDDHSDGVHQ